VNHTQLNNIYTHVDYIPPHYLVNNYEDNLQETNDGLIILILVLML